MDKIIYRTDVREWWQADQVVWSLDLQRQAEQLHHQHGEIRRLRSCGSWRGFVWLVDWGFTTFVLWEKKMNKLTDCKGGKGVFQDRNHPTKQPDLQKCNNLWIIPNSARPTTEMRELPCWTFPFQCSTTNTGGQWGPLHAVRTKILWVLPMCYLFAPHFPRSPSCPQAELREAQHLRRNKNMQKPSPVDICWNQYGI